MGAILTIGTVALAPLFGPSHLARHAVREKALRSAGARSSTTVGPNDDYVWGKPVRINEVAPGDVLQFRNWIVTTKTEVAVRFVDGTGEDGKMKMATVNTVTTVVVSGSMWAYRPQAN